MTSQVTKGPWLLTFRIGALEIARIHFEGKKPHLWAWDRHEGPFESVSAAMARMHELLKSPPEENNP